MLKEHAFGAVAPVSARLGLTHRMIGDEAAVVLPERGSPPVPARALPRERSWNGLARQLADSDEARAILFIVLVALMSRALLVVIGEVSLSLAAKTPDWTLAGLVDLFSRWDSRWYISIVEGGYRTAMPGVAPGVSNYAFSPLYPMVLTALRVLTGWPTVFAGVVASNVFFVAALILVRRYVLLLGMPESVARMTTLLIAFAPQSLVFSAVYTESLFLMLTAASMVLLRQDRPVAAGLAAALLGAVRPNGVFIVWFMLAFFIRRHGIRGLLPPWRQAEALIPLALAPAGLVLWWWFCYATTGDAFAQTSTEVHGWAWKIGMPFVNIVRFFFADAVEPPFWATVSVALFFSSFLLLRYRLYEEFLFCLANFMLSWSGVVPYSLIRFTIVLFPIFIGIAAATRERRDAGAIIVAIFASLSALLMVAWTLRGFLST